MKKFVQFWQEFQFPKSFSSDTEQQEYVVRIILLASTGVLTVTSLLILVLSMAGGPLVVIWRGLLASFAILAIGLLLIRRGYLTLTRYMMVLFIYFFGLLETLDHGLDTVYLLYFFAALVLVFLVISRKLLMILLIIFGPPVVYYFSPQITDFDLRMAVAYSTIMIMVSLLLVILTRFREAFSFEHERAREIEILQQAGTSIVSSLDFQVTIEKILEELKNIIPHDTAAVLLMQEDRTLEIVGVSGWDNPEEVIGLRFPIPGDNPNTKVIMEGRPLILGNASRAYSSFQVRQHRHIKSWLGVPLLDNDTIIGMLTIDSVEEDHFSEKQIQVVSAFADYVAVALDNAMLYEVANQAAQRRSILYQVSQEVITASADLNKIYRAIHHAADQLMPCEAFAIALVNETEEMIDGVYLIDKGGLVENIHIPLGSGLSGQVIGSGKPLIFEDVLEADNFEGHHFGHEDRVRSVVAVPLFAGGKSIGMLSAQSYQVAAYSQDDLELLELLAAQAAIAIKNAQLLVEMDRMARTDSLTGLLNRRAFEEKISDEISRAKRYGYSLCLLMIDIDDFKQFNDEFGHSKGDEHLKKISSLILNNIRQPDLVARIGGEEFSVILPHTQRAGGRDLAERIRKSIEAHFFGQVAAGSTVSIGVAEFPLDADSIETLYERADLAMFKAKRLGRNRVQLYMGVEGMS